MRTKVNLLVQGRKSRGRRSRILENKVQPDVLMMSLNSNGGGGVYQRGNHSTSELNYFMRYYILLFVVDVPGGFSIIFT